MSRRRRALERKITVDALYNNETIAKFINMLMLNGKKSVAERIVYGALGVVSEKMKKEPAEVMQEAVAAVEPSVEVKSKRVGGATYPVPIEVRSSRRVSLAMRWIINAARSRARGDMESKLAYELLDVFENKGGAIKRKEEMYRMAEANRAFSHFRF